MLFNIKKKKKQKEHIVAINYWKSFIKYVDILLKIISTNISNNLNFNIANNNIDQLVKLIWNMAHTSMQYLQTPE